MGLLKEQAPWQACGEPLSLKLLASDLGQSTDRYAAVDLSTALPSAFDSQVRVLSETCHSVLCKGWMVV